MKTQRRGAKMQRAQSFFVNMANMYFYNEYAEVTNRLNIKHFRTSALDFLLE